MTAVGFEPTRISPPELESGALDRSAKLSMFHSAVDAAQIDSYPSKLVRLILEQTRPLDIVAALV